MPIEILFAEAFLQAARKLRRRYPHILEDVEALADQLQAGETPGDRLRNVAPFLVYKVRLTNTDARRGKRGGYRVLYYVQTKLRIIVLTIYAKSDRDDISDQQVLTIIQTVEAE